MTSLAKFIALFVTALVVQGCAVQKVAVPTGGSRADGTVKLSYEFGSFEVPKVDELQARQAATKRCAAWGYKDAEAFGGSTKQCTSSSMGSCNVWMVTVEYQCLGTGSEKPAGTH